MGWANPVCPCAHGWFLPVNSMMSVGCHDQQGKWAVRCHNTEAMRMPIRICSKAHFSIWTINNRSGNALRSKRSDMVKQTEKKYGDKTCCRYGQRQRHTRFVIPIQYSYVCIIEKMNSDGMMICCWMSDMRHVLLMLLSVCLSIVVAVIQI